MVGCYLENKLRSMNNYLLQFKIQCNVFFFCLKRLENKLQYVGNINLFNIYFGN